MNNFQFPIGIEYAILYFLPILLLLFFNKSIKKIMKKRQNSLRLVDFLSPYLVVNIYFFTTFFYDYNYFLISLLIHFLIGIGLTVQLFIKKEKFRLAHFFHIWWRYGFVIYIVVYLILGFEPFKNLV